MDTFRIFQTNIWTKSKVSKKHLEFSTQMPGTSTAEAVSQQSFSNPVVRIASGAAPNGAISDHGSPDAGSASQAMPR